MIYKAFTFLMLITFITACGDNKKSDGDNKETLTVVANDVKDKESLKNFVLQAKEHLEKDFEKAISDFRTDEKWKKDSIYLFVLTEDAQSVLNAAKPETEGTNRIGVKDRNGVEIVKELIEASKKEEGDFVEYLWDNPDIEGEDESEKISYAIKFKNSDGENFLVGSGFYTEKNN